MQLHKTKNRLPMRIRLRTLLVALTIIGVCIALWSNAARRHRFAVSTLSECGRVTFEHEWVEKPGYSFADYSANDSSPKWLRAVLGPDNLRHVEIIEFSPKDDDMQSLRHVSEAKQVVLDAMDLTDLGLANLVHLEELQSLTVINGHGLTDEGFRVLGVLPLLERVHVENTPISLVGVRRLANCTKLKQLTLRGTKVRATDKLEVDRTFPGASFIWIDPYRQYAATNPLSPKWTFQRPDDSSTNAGQASLEANGRFPRR